MCKFSVKEVRNLTGRFFALRLHDGAEFTLSATHPPVRLVKSPSRSVTEHDKTLVEARVTSSGVKVVNLPEVEQGRSYRPPILVNPDVALHAARAWDGLVFTYEQGADDSVLTDLVLQDP